MITNMHHVGEGAILFTFKNGDHLATTVRLNDRAGRVFMIENDGFCDVVEYADVHHATARSLREHAGT